MKSLFGCFRFSGVIAAVMLSSVFSLAARAQTSAAPLSCTTSAAAISNYFNTASNGSGGILASGTDNHWEVTIPGVSDMSMTDAGNPFAPSLNWVPAIVVTNPAAWRPNALDAAWIGQAADASQNPGSTYDDIYYRIPFYLDASVNPATFQLTMNFWADNTVFEVWINGLSQTGLGVGTLPQDPIDPYFGNQYGPGAPGTFYTFSQGWQTGLNTLVIDVKSGSSLGVGGYGFNGNTVQIIKTGTG
jgi:hypothetical protein